MSGNSEQAEGFRAPLHRRDILKGMSAAAALGTGIGARAASGTPQRHVAIVGAGIIGVSIAWHLARSGIKVSVIDKGKPGMGCTQGAFAMLIAGHADGPEHFNALYGVAVQDWRRLQAEIGEPLPIQWGGTANWALPGEPAKALETERRRLQSWGVDARAIDADTLAKLCPGLVPGTFGAGNYLPEQGAVDVMGAFTVLYHQCLRKGVTFHNAAIDAISTDAAGKAHIVAGGAAIAADTIVIAAGAGSTAVAASAGVKVPLDLVSGTLAHTKPLPQILPCVLNGPGGSIKQNPDGRIVTGLDYAPGADGKDISEAYGRTLLAHAAAMVPALRNAELDFMTLGYVPIPAEGQQPIVGYCARPGNLYVAAMMSGVTMAPLMGRLIATEIAEDTRLDLLAPYRPHRFNPQWTQAADRAPVPAPGLTPIRIS